MVKWLTLNRIVACVHEFKKDVVLTALGWMFDAIVREQILTVKCDDVVLTAGDAGRWSAHGNSKRRKSISTTDSDLIDHTNKRISVDIVRRGPYSSIPGMVTKSHDDLTCCQYVWSGNKNSLEWSDIIGSWSLVGYFRVLYLELFGDVIIVCVTCIPTLVVDLVDDWRISWERVMGLYCHSRSDGWTWRLNRIQSYSYSVVLTCIECSYIG